MESEDDAPGVSVPFGVSVALVLTCILSSLLSILGSSLVIRLCLDNLGWWKSLATTTASVSGGNVSSARRGSLVRSRTSSTTLGNPQPARNDVYYLLVLFLSLGDELASLNLMWIHFAPPAEMRDDMHIPWARGNRTTCSVAGFLILFGQLYTAHWNFLLAFYFLLSIRYGINVQVQVPTWIRIGSAVVAIGLPLVVCGYIAWKQSYGFAMLTYSCNVGRYPTGCIPNETCESGNDSLLYSSICATILLALGVAGCVCTLLVYCTIRQRIMANRSYSFTRDLTTVQCKLVRQSGWQAVFYYLAYLNSSIWPMVAVVVGSQMIGDAPFDFETNRSPTAIMILFCFASFLPLQGFLNAIIFLRPHYTQWRELNPQAPWTWIIWKCAKGERPSRSFAPRTEEDLDQQGEQPGGTDNETVKSLAAEAAAPPEAPVDAADTTTTIPVSLPLVVASTSSVHDAYSDGEG